MTDQRPPPPILRNITKHPMFDLIPLAGPRRKVPDVERQTDLVGELLEFDLPQPIATGIAPPTIGRDEDGVGSNASRNRLWKVELQQLADEIGLALYVRHF